MHGEVTVHMAAPPEAVWGLVSDVTRIGSYSPETYEAKWERGRRRSRRGRKIPRPREAQRVVAGPLLDELHRVRLRTGQDLRVRCGQRPVEAAQRVALRHRASGDGCDVTESFTLTPTRGLRLYWTLMGWSRGKTNRDGMRATLERVRAEVESPRAPTA